MTKVKLNMHWKIACAESPKGVAFRQVKTGLVLRESSGHATFYMYKDFPRINRPALDRELENDTDWTPLKTLLPTVSR